MSKQPAPNAFSMTASTLKPPVKAEEECISFQKLSSAEPVKYIKVAVHGQQKAGKTRFGLTAPGPVYVIATEPGLRPLIKLFPDKEVYFADVYVVDPTEVFEVDPIKTLEKIDSAVKIIRKMVAEKPDSVGTIVFDNVTDLWKVVQEWMKMDILKIDKTARVRQQWDWGYANTKYQNIIMQLLSLPCHLVLTGQDKEEYSGPGDASGVYSARWQSQTPYLVDIVLGLVKMRDPNSGKTRYIANIEDSRHMDEDLEPIAGKTIENLDFTKLLELLNKKKE